MFLAVLLLPLIAHAESESAVGEDVFPNTGFAKTDDEKSNWRDDCKWYGSGPECEGWCPADKIEFWSAPGNLWSEGSAKYKDFGWPCITGRKNWCCPKKCQNTFNLVGEGRKCEKRTFKGTGKTYTQCVQLCLQDTTCKAVFGALNHNNPDKIRGDGACWTCTSDEPEGFDANYNVYRRDCRQCLDNFSYVGKKSCSKTRIFVGLKMSYTTCTESCTRDWKCRGVFGTLDANQKDNVISDGSCWKCYGDDVTTSQHYNMYKRKCPDYAADDAKKLVDADIGATCTDGKKMECGNIWSTGDCRWDCAVVEKFSEIPTEGFWGLKEQADSRWGTCLYKCYKDCKLCLIPNDMGPDEGDEIHPAVEFAMEMAKNLAPFSANQASAGEFQSVAMVSAEPFNATDALVLLFAAVGILAVVGLTYKEGKRRLQSHPYENVDTV